MISDKVISDIQDCVLVWLATANAEGEPNVSPKEMFMVWDKSSILIANIASPTSAKNIIANPRVCLSFIHVFKQKGYKMKGLAKLIYHDSKGFDEKIEHFHMRFTDKFKIDCIIEIKIDNISPIMAPSYRFFPQTTSEDSQITSAMEAYKVNPK